MTGIKLDATWVGGYAKLAASSADTLAEGVDTMAISPLDDSSFGELGRALNTAQAYGKAARLLRDQLARAVETLSTASDGLEKVTTVYQDTDESGMRAIKRELK
ncbi:hypothetical protein [Actinophytocola sp.]|uniref:hypothetical protein n=1 Tax=Actinophytocola sp. TaxID=1872138 RepID=UPI002ED1FD94